MSPKRPGPCEASIGSSGLNLGAEAQQLVALPLKIERRRLIFGRHAELGFPIEHMAATQPLSGEQWGHLVVVCLFVCSSLLSGLF